MRGWAEVSMGLELKDVSRLSSRTQLWVQGFPRTGNMAGSLLAGTCPDPYATAAKH